MHTGKTHVYVSGNIKGAKQATASPYTCAGVYDLV